MRHRMAAARDDEAHVGTELADVERLLGPEVRAAIVEKSNDPQSAEPQGCGETGRATDHVFWHWTLLFLRLSTLPCLRAA